MGSTVWRTETLGNDMDYNILYNIVHMGEYFCRGRNIKNSIFRKNEKDKQNLSWIR